MAEIRRIAKQIGTTALLMDALETELVSAGWTLHDDQWNGSSGYLVFSSQGNPARRAPTTCFLEIGVGTNYIFFRRWAWWDNVAHSGTLSIGSTSTQMATDDDATFYYWLYGNEDFLCFYSLVGSTYDMVYIGRFIPATTGIGVVSAAASSGASVTISLRPGDAQKFFINSVVSVYDAQDGSWNGRDYRSKITSIDFQNDTITVDNLNINLRVGAIVSYAQDFWTSMLNGLTSYLLGCEAATATGTGSNVTQNDNASALIVDTYTDPDYHSNNGTSPSNLWSLQPLRIPRNNTGIQGILDRNWMLCSDNADTTNYEDIVPVGLRRDENQATGGGSNTIQDTGESWTVNEWAGKVVMITQGTGAGQMRKIASNTANEITVTENWSTQPDGTSYYAIADEGWRYFGFGNAQYSHAIKEQPEFDYFTSYLVTTTTTTTTTTTA